MCVLCVCVHVSICWYCTHLHTLHSSAGNRSNIRSASRTQTRLPCSRSARQPGRCECSSHTRSHLQSKSTALFSWAPKCNILTQSQGRKWKVTVHPMKLMEKQAGEAAVWKKQTGRARCVFPLVVAHIRHFASHSLVLALWRTVKIFGWPDLLKAITLD